ncbi:MAG: hypothetical protein AUJ49_04360 [Desulfovibrionaceae bacterium CG1_02_65_16]|nr:MAG: hypothetical protein AUJ49_04360 [Desulfovibrionaceae bacterium CG1_02_65_16]
MTATTTHRAGKNAGKVRELLKRLESLPAPPAVAARVLEWVTQADPNIADICQIIASDPSLSLKVLKLANVRVHGLQRGDMKIERAASMLGTATLRQVLLGIIIRDTLFLEHKRDDPQLARIWLHSLACATATQLLAGKLAPKLAEPAFSCGLAHDCGKLALLCALPEAYEALLERAPLSGQPLHALEAEALGMDHAEAGKWLAQSWGLPGLFVDSAWLHHQPEAVLEDLDEHGGMLTLLALGDILAHEVLAEPLDASTMARRKHLLDRVNLSFHQVEQLKERVAVGLAERREFFSLGGEDAVATFCVALQRAGGLLARMNQELEARRAADAQVNSLLAAVAGAGQVLARARETEDMFAAVRSALDGDFGIAQGCVYILDALEAGEGDDGRLCGLAWGDGAEEGFSWALDAVPANAVGANAVGANAVQVNADPANAVPANAVGAVAARSPAKGSAGKAVGASGVDTPGVDTSGDRPSEASAAASPLLPFLPLLRIRAEHIRAERIADTNGQRFSDSVGAFAQRFARSFRIVPLVLDHAVLGELILVETACPPASGQASESASDSVVQAQTRCLEQLCGLLAAALERRRAAASLEARSERLGAAMRKMQQINQKLIQAERLAAVGQLAAGAAHEINNPLAIIYARLQILGLKETNEAQRAAFRQMEEQIGRISAILTQLMDFARPTQPQFAPVDLNALLTGCLSMMSGNFEKRGAKVICGMQADLPPVWADAKLLEQVFVNLFINAEHAMEGGAGALGVRTAWRGGQGHVRVDVEDTGCGIAPEHLESIFDPFFTTKEGKGTGLGLSTSYSIIKSHQGDIRVTSTLGKGTLFRLSLPVAPASVPAGDLRPRKGGAAKRSGGDILVVDDEVRIQELLVEALEMHGYTAAACGDGEAALQLLKKRRFNLMLLDIRMPSRSGLWLLAEIRRAAIAMPVIVITGLATSEERNQALELGAVRCFQKPFKVDELLDAVDAALRTASRTALRQ